MAFRMEKIKGVQKLTPAKSRVKLMLSKPETHILYFDEFPQCSIYSGFTGCDH